METETKELISRAFDMCMSGVKRTDMENETHIVKAYWVVDLIRIDVEKKK